MQITGPIGKNKKLRKKLKKEKEEQQSMIPYIPEEIVADILSRIPTKSLFRFKSVSKRWQSLIWDSEFSQFITIRGAERPLIYTLPPSSSRNDESEGKFWSLDFENLRVQRVPNPLKDVLPHQDHSVKILGSCNGVTLLCGAESLYLWNPSTRCCIQVLHLNFLKEKFGVKFETIKASGLCYDDSSNDYKAVIGISVPAGDKYPGLRARASPVFVIVAGLTSKTLKTRELPFDLRGTGALLHGNLHWLAHKHHPGHAFILGFGAKTNTWFELAAPRQLEYAHRHLFDYQIGVSDGRLGLFQGDIFARIEYFVMKQYGMKRSWTVMFRNMAASPWTDSELIRDPAFSISSRGDILLINVRGLGLCKLEDGSSTSIAVPTDFAKGGFREAIAYVESLVSLQDICPDVNVMGWH